MKAHTSKHPELKKSYPQFAEYLYSIEEVVLSFQSWHDSNAIPGAGI